MNLKGIIKLSSKDLSEQNLLVSIYLPLLLKVFINSLCSFAVVLQSVLQDLSDKFPVCIQMD